MSDKLTRTRDGAIARWTIDDPASRNTLTGEIVEAMLAACADAAADPSLRFVVLSGSDGAFCAGGSLGGFATSIGRPLADGEIDPLIALNMRFGDLLHALCALPQVLIAAVDGPAMGGGFGLACCADFCIASERASFATPEVTLGIVAAQIAPFVWRRLGDRAARQCLLQGQRYSAIEASALGLVDEVAADARVAAAALIERLKAAAPGAVAATKRLLNQLDAAATLDLRVDAAHAFAASLRSPEALDGLAAFGKKRKPRWAE